MFGTHSCTLVNMWAHVQGCRRRSALTGEKKRKSRKRTTSWAHTYTHF